jgi:23S rRNA pseudouridine1911/1915/1917 synthase
VPRIGLCVVVEATERIDRFLADQLQLSRTQSARLLADQHVTVNEAIVRASRVLTRGDTVVVEIPDDEPPRSLVPAAIPLAIVYEDDALAVINKPAGLVVHPAPGHWDDTLVNALVARGLTLAGGAAGRPGIVHRLDRDTSGLIIVSKTDEAHRRLSRAIAGRQVHRVYAALAWGHLPESPLLIDAPIARAPGDRKRMAVVEGGRAARTTARVVARFPVSELLRLELETGRTHQIRVHLAHVGHPVIGDPVYGGGGSRRVTGSGRALADRIDRATPRQALHAAALAFRHPMTGEALVFQADWPADLMPALKLAADSEVVAPDGPLRYLRFFNRDG